jgi:hypothetical protein
MCHPRKSNPFVEAVSFVFCSLTFIPLSARNWLIFSRISRESPTSYEAGRKSG